MSTEQIPLIQKDISMLTDKIEKMEKKQDDEARKAQLHRDESLRFHADLMEKLETKFAGKWTEKVLIFIGSGIGTTLLVAIMALLLKN